jgi:membrane protein DedA with SNARE-associated domain
MVCNKRYVFFLVFGNNNNIIIIALVIHNTFFIHYGLAGLFANSALSPLIPIPVEIAVSALILAGKLPLIVIFLVLAVGSFIGDLLAYFIGYGGNSTLLKIHRKVKVSTGDSSNNDKRMRHLLSKYGWIVIFFSPWVPFVGNAIVILAGSRRFDIKTFSISVASGQVLKAFVTVYLLSFILANFFHNGGGS